MLTDQEKAFLQRITDYSDKVLGAFDPEKTPVSFQLDKLRPVMDTIASEEGCAVEEIFIRYMDLVSRAGVENRDKAKEDYQDFEDMLI